MENKIRATITHSSIQNQKKNYNQKSNTKFEDDEYKRLSVLYSGQIEFKNMKEEKTKRVYISHSQASEFVTNLYHYLKNNNFPFSYKRSSLKIASLTMFNNIFIFLLNKIDEDVETLEFATEDLIDIFKQIGCPINLQKGIFKSIGLPNNWNLILGVLSWLCDFVIEKEKISEIILEEENEDIFSDVITKHVFKEKSMGNNELEFEIKNELDVKFKDMNEVKNILEKEIENEQFKTDEFIGSFKSLKDSKNKKINLEIELENINLHINKEEKNLNNSKKNKLDFEKNIIVKQNELESVKKCIEDLQTKIDIQGITKEECEKINNENIKIMNELKDIKKEYEIKDKEIKENSEKIQEDLQEILDLLEKINRKDLKNDFENEINDPNFDQFSDLREKIKKINRDLKEKIILLNKKIFESETQESNLRFNLNKKNREYWKSNTDIEEKRNILNDLRLKDISMKDKFQEDYKKYLEKKKEINQSNINLKIENDLLIESIKKLENEQKNLVEILEKLDKACEIMKNTLKEETAYITNILLRYKLAVGNLIKNNYHMIEEGIQMIARN